ncbi:thioesterase family protein [Microtetraspora sp. NBRC 13810]|uniref:acyl-CoA thioesterase n=1 Tax=Microtetraspora sp. NBRC 13810 TaxID=3030990 RepID=UPI002555242C|nr:thioesterase family protein [Microtetraspora sp. NBRC 13810]
MRFADVDSLGHVNNVRFFDFLEDARQAMFRTDRHRRGEPPFAGLVVARHEIDYRRPLGFRHDPVVVETRVSDIRAARFTLDHRIRDEEQVFAQARSVLVAYDIHATGPRRLRKRNCPTLRRSAKFEVRSHGLRLVGVWPRSVRRCLEWDMSVGVG